MAEFKSQVYYANGLVKKSQSMKIMETELMWLRCIPSCW